MRLLNIIFVCPFDDYVLVFGNFILSTGMHCRFFMEKQVMGEFVRILKVSRTHAVSLQLLQTLSIMIQNLKSEHAICKFGISRANLFMA